MHLFELIQLDCFRLMSKNGLPQERLELRSSAVPSPPNAVLSPSSAYLMVLESRSATVRFTLSSAINTRAL